MTAPKPRVSHKVAALDALSLAVKRLEAMPPTPEVRYALVDLRVAQEALEQVQELVKPRRLKVAADATAWTGNASATTQYYGDKNEEA